MSKKVFLTFANKKLWRSSNRIINQAKKLNYFDDLINTNEDNLNINFKIKHFKILNENTRGYGYWIWKPRIILDILTSLNENDILLYCDAGCHLNKNGIKILNEYIEKTKFSKNGIIAFRYESDNLNKIITKQPYQLEWQNKKFITKELLMFMDLDNEFVKNRNIVAAGILFIKKTNSSIKILNEWLEIMENNYHLYDGTYDPTINDIDFVASRHDQSIFSLLCEKYDIDCLSGYEHYFPINNQLKVDWGILKDFPIHAKRDKDFGFIINLIEKIKYKLNH